MGRHDDDKIKRAQEMYEEFRDVLVKKYDDREVVLRAVTQILAMSALTAASSPSEACDFVEAMSAQAIEVIVKNGRSTP